MSAHTFACRPRPAPIRRESSRLARVRRVTTTAVGPGRNVNLRLLDAIDRALTALWDAGRRSISIVDTRCGDGRLLAEAARRARERGFVAIEATGLDGSEARVARLRTGLAGRTPDPAVGLRFAPHHPGQPLPVEDCDADLMLATAADEAALADELDRVRSRHGVVLRRD